MGFLHHLNSSCSFNTLRFSNVLTYVDTQRTISVVWYQHLDQTNPQLKYQ